MNNLQANKLANLGFNSKYRLLSEDINIGKKELKKIERNSWIELDVNSIKALFLDDNKIVANMVLSVESNYLFIKSKILKKSKKYKNNSSKSSFNLEINYKNLRDGKYIIDKLPIDVKLLCMGKEFAEAKLFFSNKFYLEIEELLWKRF